MATSGTLTIPVGRTSTNLTVTVNGDTLYEVNETFSVLLSNFSNATTNDATGVGTITTDDTIPPTLTIQDASVVEGDTGTTNMAFTVTLSPVSGADASFDFTTVDGTAQGGSDFVADLGTLVIPAG